MDECIDIIMDTLEEYFESRMYNSYILNSVFMDKENYIEYEKYKELSKQKSRDQVSKQLVDKEEIKKRNENILLNFLKSSKKKVR